jgi:hypothetical protein
MFKEEGYKLMGAAFRSVLIETPVESILLPARGFRNIKPIEGVIPSNGHDSHK